MQNDVATQRWSHVCLNARTPARRRSRHRPQRGLIFTLLAARVVFLLRNTSHPFLSRELRGAPRPRRLCRPHDRDRRASRWNPCPCRTRPPSGSSAAAAALDAHHNHGRRESVELVPPSPSSPPFYPDPQRPDAIIFVEYLPSSSSFPACSPTIAAHQPPFPRNIPKLPRCFRAPPTLPN